MSVPPAVPSTVTCTRRRFLLGTAGTGALGLLTGAAAVGLLTGCGAAGLASPAAGVVTAVAATTISTPSRTEPAESTTAAKAPTATDAAPTFDSSYTFTDAEWQQRLTREQYDVLRASGTEAPFSSPLDAQNDAGVFGCAGCALELFSSTAKFDSGTGWPSFWDVIDNAVLESPDTTAGMIRTEVRCRRCGGHLGHLFEDGPPPTGLRYCMNGVAMTFRRTY